MIIAHRRKRRAALGHAFMNGSIRNMSFFILVERINLNRSAVLISESVIFSSRLPTWTKILGCSVFVKTSGY